MKKINYLLILLSALLISACSGSESYRGAWKATKDNGDRLDIEFKEKSFSIKDSTGNIQEYEYTQNSVAIVNSITTYGINVNDGRTYKINFPLPKDISKGFILDSNGLFVYVISRKNYLKYEDVY